MLHPAFAVSRVRLRRTWLPKKMQQAEPTRWRPPLLILGVSLMALSVAACRSGDGADRLGLASTTSTPSNGDIDATPASMPSGVPGPPTATPTGTDTPRSGGASGRAAFDAGNRIAHAAMLLDQDLPGTGWSTAAVDTFAGSLLDADPTDQSSIPGCRIPVARTTIAIERLDDQSVGRASKRFTRFGLVTAVIGVEVRVYKDSKTATDVASRVAGILGGSDFGDCFRKTFAASQALVPGLQFDVRTVNPITTTPHSGASAAFDIESGVAGIKIQLHQEFHVWASSNAVVDISVLAATDVSAELVPIVANTTNAKLSTAQAAQ